MTAVDPYLWHEEQGRSWYTLSDTINTTVAPQDFSICLPPGDYTVQYWDVCGGGGDCSQGWGFNAGTPPNTTYGGGWEIGDPSLRVSVAAGGQTHLGLQAIHSGHNIVPSSDNFYGGYAIWSYGDCASGCPSGTSCVGTTCRDTQHDFQVCGGATFCDGGSCCGGSCTDVFADNNNCGGCGVVCGPNSTCTNGQCTGTLSGCGMAVAEVTKDTPYDSTNYTGVFAVNDGGPYLNWGAANIYWPGEQAKAWTELNGQMFADPSLRQFYATCLQPGLYTLLTWNLGCVNNTGGCGTFSDGTPPSSYTYLWQIGDSTRQLQVSQGSVAGVSLRYTGTNVPASDNFYGEYALWSYGGCGTFCPPNSGCQVVSCPSGTTCYQGACYDEGYDINHCSGDTTTCAGSSCCNGGCVDIATDHANCGGCGIACAANQTCSGYRCQ